jgi:4-hydroxy-3-methylbut-2-enyl diphosphate reductase
LIDDCGQIDTHWLAGVARVGMTSGASVPDHLVQAAAEYFRRQGASVESLGFVEENIHFALPFRIHPSQANF